MNLIASMILGFVIDLIVGDPHGLIHPVQIIGWFITKIKEGLQRLIYGCSYEEAKAQGLPRKEDKELIAGYALTVIIVLGTFFVISGILYIAQLIHPALRFVLETFFIYQILATKSLRRESMKVYARLKEGDLAGARKEILLSGGAGYPGAR